MKRTKVFLTGDQIKQLGKIAARKSLKSTSTITAAQLIGITWKWV
jgi:hypothetical protein